MSFKPKIIFFCLLFLVGMAYFGYRYYRAMHPRYIPPPPVREEVSVTIIPGWNLRQIAENLVSKGFASSTKDIYALTGEPAVDYRLQRQKITAFGAAVDILNAKPDYLSYEGYFAPETFRVYRNASLKEVLLKFLTERNRQMAGEEIKALLEQSGKNVHEILTMASILEREARTLEDRRLVADILWRRNKMRWALQVDSSVHYIVARIGDVFTTDQERKIDSYWNTYKYPGLPPGPIGTPSISSIKAAADLEENKYWYFLTGNDGKMYYAKTLEEHNRNRIQYLK